MGFKMKGAPYTSGGAKNINTVLAGKDSAQVPAKRKGTKMYKDEGPMMYKDEGPMMYENGGPKEMDPMHNGEPGVQQEDFKQFSSKGAKYHGKIHTDKEDKKRKEGKYVSKAPKYHGKIHTDKEDEKRNEGKYAPKASKGSKYHGKIHTDKENKKRKEGKYVAKTSKGSKMHEGKPHGNKKNKKTE